MGKVDLVAIPTANYETFYDFHIGRLSQEDVGCLLRFCNTIVSRIFAMAHVYLVAIPTSLPYEDTSTLIKSIQALSTSAQGINIEKERSKGSLKVRELNDRLMMAEQALTDRDGLFKRPWYKHLLYGPSKNDDYGSKSFHGVDDTIDNAKRVKDQSILETCSTQDLESLKSYKTGINCLKR